MLQPIRVPANRSKRSGPFSGTVTTDVTRFLVSLMSVFASKCSRLPQSAFAFMVNRGEPITHQKF
jgi:hypothetical protein